ncbi:MAG TPA: DUF6225 family protein [Gemmataceae bacterium]|nr:DUF6225 family protein [Gemmataceae bacterium]
MTDQDEELFDHQVTAWTAGALRKALDGVPGDWPVRVITAEEPGGGLADEQVVISAGPWSDCGDGSGPPDHFEISCEFPSGQYYRRVR